MSLETRIAALLGPVIRQSPLSGGCVGDVRLVELEDGRKVVAKIGDDGVLTVEAAMLRFLAEHTKLPVPAVQLTEENLLVMDYIPAGDGLTPAAEADAAAHIAALHDITGPAFGFAWDTVIGGLPQPNPVGAAWRDFFRDRRLIAMGRSALDAGRLPSTAFLRLERLCGRLDQWIGDSAKPALIHGDLWGGNILTRGNRIVGFIDPAIYYADPEIELAFATLFDTFGDAFFRRYGELRPLRPGFFEERRDLYNLYPLLVHCRLFGGGYVSRVEQTLAKYGC